MKWNDNDTKYIFKRVILYLIIGGILFFSARNCSALTLGSWNINQYYNGNNHTYDLYPNAFKYNNEWFNTYMGNYADVIFWGTNGYTTSMNYHFDNPCQQGESYTYNQVINFYKVGSVELSLNSLRVVSGVNECAGSWNYNGSNWQYIYQCTFKDGVPRSSWYFDWYSVSGIEWYDDIQYRVGIADTTITCQLNTGALIANDNNNTNRIINNQTNNTQQIINSQTEINNSINDLNDSIMEDYQVPSDLEDNFEFSDWFSQEDSDFIRGILLFPFRIFSLISGALDSNTCIEYSFGRLLGYELKLPCINYKQYIGNVIYIIIDTVFALVIVFGLIRYMISVYDFVFSIGLKGASVVAAVEVFK